MILHNTTAFDLGLYAVGLTQHLVNLAWPQSLQKLPTPVVDDPAAQTEIQEHQLRRLRSLCVCVGGVHDVLVMYTV